MYASAQSPNRSSGSASYGFATPIRTPSTSYHNPSSYSQALTPAADASSKAVRFQSQPLPPQTQPQPQQQLQQSSSTTTTAATPNRSPYYTAPQSSALTQTQTQTQSPHRPNTTTPGAPATPSNMVGTKASVASVAAVASNGASTIALARRIKWNLSALGVLWILPALTSRPRDAYWAVLDQIYIWTGGETDEIVDGVLGWVLWAVSVVLLFNAVEAFVLVQRSNTPRLEAMEAKPGQSATAGVGAGKQGPVLGMHSPQVAKSINFVAASRLKGSPKTRTSNIGAGSPIAQSSSPHRNSPSAPSADSASVDYSQFSPSLRRASSPISSSSSTQNGFGSGSASGSRMGTPVTSAVGVGMVGNSSSPLAAFRARHGGKTSSPSPSSVRARSITPSVSNVDLSFEADTGEQEEAAFLGDESFEVDRALRSLRTSLGGVSSTPAPFR